MNDNTLIVVHTWAGDRERVERLLPLWTHHEQQVLLVSPEDAPLRFDPPATASGGLTDRGVYCRSAGGNGWMGTHVPHRLLKHWRIALEYRADWFFINEWDSFCFTPELPAELYEDDDMFWSIEVEEVWEVEPVKSGLRCSFPYWMSRKFLRKFLDAAESIIDDVTAGPDLDLYGNMSPDGFTMHVMNTFGFRHQPFRDAYDSRAGLDGPLPRIIHWHGLTDPNLPLLAVGYL